MAPSVFFLNGHFDYWGAFQTVLDSYYCVMDWIWLECMGSQGQIQSLEREGALFKKFEDQKKKQASVGDSNSTLSVYYLHL